MADVDWKMLGFFLTAQMEKDRLTVRGLAEKIGIDKSAISRVRKAIPVSVAPFLAICRYLKKSPYGFFIAETVPARSHFGKPHHARKR